MAVQLSCSPLKTLAQHSNVQAMQVVACIKIVQLVFVRKDSIIMIKKANARYWNPFDHSAKKTFFSITSIIRTSMNVWNTVFVLKVVSIQLARTNALVYQNSNYRMTIVHVG